MKPPRRGPSSGPINGAAVYTIIGAESSDLVNISPTVPPATDKKAEPDRPSRNRHTSMVAIFGATAHGISQIRKKRYE